MESINKSYKQEVEALELHEVLILKYNLTTEGLLDEMHDSFLINLLEGLPEGIFELRREQV